MEGGDSGDVVSGVDVSKLFGNGRKRVESPGRKRFLETVAMVVLGQAVLAPAALGRQIVTLTTDFGLANEAVGLVHGAVLAIDSDIEVVDLCHAVGSFDVLLGALTLAGTDIFPVGTVHIAVIDPGVGTPRAPIAVRTRVGQYYVGPNNGLFTEVIRRQGLDSVVRLEPLRVNPRWAPGTFDGRDLFGPAGAFLATTNGDLARVGRSFPADSLVQLELPAPTVDVARRAVEGVVLRIDEPYGNVWTNIGAKELEGIGVEVGGLIDVGITPGGGGGGGGNGDGDGGNGNGNGNGEPGAGDDPVASAVQLRLPLVVTFGDVPEGSPLAYIASAGSLGFAINLGSFRDVYSVAPGWRVKVEARD